MALTNRLTDFLNIRHPVLLAPMAQISGGRLAAAVTGAGGLGLIAGGYGDAEWLQREFELAGDARVGCGFITWSLARQPEALDLALQRQPAAIMLSFGDPAGFADRIREAGVPLICQVQSVAQAHRALEVCADILVAQGTEAGGHGMTARSTITLVPEVVDLVVERSPETLVVAAGGVGDGRGMAAALALGADGVLVGTRFWASSEALVSPKAHERALRVSGNETIRTRVYDVVRQLDWPSEFDERALVNSFVETWHGNETELSAHLPEAVESFRKAVAAEDFDVAHILVGEAIGLIRDVRPADELLAELVAEAARILHRPG
jgi:nitronate monooxygenase